MEKRVFSLASREEKRYAIGFLVLWTFLIVGNLWWRPGYRWIAALEVALLFIIMAWRYWSNRMRRLEISEQGLVMISWLRKPVSIGWEAISKIKIGPEMLSFSVNKRYDSALITSIDGNYIFISGTNRDAPALIDILKQRLPENLFEAK